MSYTTIAFCVLFPMMSVALWVLFRRLDTLHVLFHAHKRWAVDHSDIQERVRQGSARQWHEEMENFGRHMRTIEQRVDSWAENMQNTASRHLVSQVERAVEDVDRRLGRIELSTGGLWKTAQGHLMQVRDMDDKHLDNAIMFLHDTHQNRSPDLDREARRRVEAIKIQAEVERERKAKAKLEAWRNRQLAKIRRSRRPS
jgi:hypothetical protein